MEVNLENMPIMESVTLNRQGLGRHKDEIEIIEFDGVKYSIESFYGCFNGLEKSISVFSLYYEKSRKRKFFLVERVDKKKIENENDIYNLIRYCLMDLKLPLLWDESRS